MATQDHTAQFQEPPVASIPTHRNPSSTEESAQFQEPISSTSSLGSNADSKDSSNASSHDKSTGDKIKDVVKKPFHSSSREEVKSPEMQAGLDFVEEQKR